MSDAEHNEMIDDVLVSLNWLLEKMDILGDPDRNALVQRVRTQIEFMNKMRNE